MLNSTEIHDFLNQLGFEIEPHKKQPSYAYEHYLGEGGYLYVKRKEGRVVNESPLVLPPDYRAQKERIDAVDGIFVNWETPIKNTSYRRYPKFEGNKSQFGYAANVSSCDALRELITLLSGVPKLLEPENRSSTFSESKILAMTPLNQILYGPPGTGKTYHTIEAAVRAAEPTFPVTDDRSALKAKYDELISAGRIRFVTFHQSYGYEEFVEGVRASTQDGNVNYSLESGIFKQICETASSSQYQRAFELNPQAKVWKLSIERAGRNSVAEECFNKNIAAIGWGYTGDLTSDNLSEEQKEYFQSLGSNDKSTLNAFSEQASEGDIIVCIGSKRTVQAVGIVSGPYRYVEKGTTDRQDYQHWLPVDWLVTGVNVPFYELNDNTEFTQKTFYNLWRVNPADVFELLQKYNVEIATQSINDKGKDNYVLIIDEINRGNISKIFGELITLIESSKRHGQPEALAARLPYSLKPFYVPDNLYIIGTMNTADRSLAMMDTALRRRFEFVEMMPEPALLDGVVVKGIDLKLLLKTLNERIEVLYDREHTLGHAYFMPVKKHFEDGREDRAFNALKSVFQNKVIPLLEEYFFEDWQKIRLVLADNQKIKSLQFVRESEVDYARLFGNDHQLTSFGSEEKSYQLADFNAEVWNNPFAYQTIYQPEGIQLYSEDETAYPVEK